MAKIPLRLDQPKRASRVLVSQGYAAGLLKSFPKDIQESLAALCSEDGTLAANARDAARTIIDKYHDSQKATVERGGFGHGT